MKRVSTPLAAIVGLIAASGSFSAMAQSDWEWKLDAQGSYGSYSGSTLRDDVSSVGAIVSGEYLDSGGITLGYTYTTVGLKAPASDIDQSNIFLSGRLHFTPDQVPGRISLRMDVHFVDNNDPTGNTDEVTVVAPQVSYLSFDKNLYLDLGYARSVYQNSLSLNQWTPTIGFAMNDGSDWLQARLYYIESSNAARSQGKSNTSAIEAKYTHYFGPNGIAGLDNLQLGALLGERMFAVDGDAGAIYNLADIQKGALTVGGQWKLDESSRILLVGGYEKYTNNTIADDYNSTFVYLNYSAQF